MSPLPSYYDSIGLLVICDAVDAVDGIPFHPVTRPKPPSFRVSKTINKAPPPTGKLPASAGKNAPVQHSLLTHIPVTGVFSPFGTISYDEQQRMAINQLASTGQLPQQPPVHTIGGVRPNIPVAHNLHSSSGQRSRSMSVAQSPSTRIGSPHANMNQHTPSMSTGSQMTRPVQSPMMSRPQQSESPGIPPMAAAGQSPTPIPQSTSGSTLNSPGLSAAGLSNQGFNGSATNIAGLNNGLGAGPLGGAQLNQGPHNPTGLNPQGLTAAGLGAPILNTQSFMGLPSMGGAGTTGATPLLGDSRASTPGSPLDTSQSQYRVEVCQICGRDFKGRKAATHKQQHIRRLHPAEYTPKRGGKKSRTD